MIVIRKFFILILLISNLSSGQNVKLMLPSGHTGYVRSLSFSPDGSILASGAGVTEDALLLWDTRTGREINSFKIYDADNITFSPNGNFLAAGGSSGIRLWDIKTGEAKSLQNEGGWVYSIAFTSDSKHIASGFDPPGQGYLHKIQIRSVATGQIVGSFSGKIQSVCSMVFSPADSILATSGGIDDPDIVELWNPWSGRLINTFTNSGGDLLISVDGKYLIAGSNERLNIYTIPEGQLIYSGATIGRPVGFTKEGEIVAYIDNGKTAIFFSLEEKEIKRTLHFDAWYKFAYDSNNNVLASIADKGKIVLLDAVNSDVLYTFGEDCSVCGTVNLVKNILVNSDSVSFAIQSDDNRFRVWSSRTNVLQTLEQLPRNWKTVIANSTQEQSKLLEDLDEFQNVEFNCISPNLKYLAISRGYDIDLFSEDSDQVMQSFPTNSFSPQCSFSADSRKLFVINRIGITIYKINGGKELGSLVSLSDSDWVFITPEGLYDGTAEGIKFPYWVENNRPILLENYTKSRYESGLLRKVLNDN